MDRESCRWRYELKRPPAKCSDDLYTEVWWYIGGEYGGGSWTAENINNHPGSNRFDINDIRVYFGIDWNNLNRYNGIFEVGYVFEREVFYVRDAPDQVLPIRDTIMLRAGLTF